MLKEALHYRNNSQLQYALSLEILQNVFLKGNETILDVGCGDGRITADISKCVPQGSVIGIDSSFSMISLAQNSFQNENYPNLRFEKRTAEKAYLPHPVDLILLLNTLHWIKTPKQTLKRLVSFLKPNGTLLILTYPKESPYWQFLEKTIHETRWLPYAHLSAYKTILSTQEYLQTIEDIGLKIESHSLEEKIATSFSSEELYNYIKGWLKCYIRLPKHLENAFLETAVKNAQRYSLTKDNSTIQLSFLKLSIKARYPKDSI